MKKLLIFHVHTCKTSKLEQRIPCKFLAIFNKCLTPLTLTLVAFILANLRLEAQGFSFFNVPKRLITPWSVTFDEPVTLTSCKVKGKIFIEPIFFLFFAKGYWFRISFNVNNTQLVQKLIWSKNALIPISASIHFSQFFNENATKLHF